MAISKCRECGNQISKKAKSCPQCGNPVKKKTSKLLIGLILVLGLPFALCFISGIVSTIMDLSDAKPTSTNTANKRDTATPSQPKSDFLYACRTYPSGTLIENQYIRKGPSMDSAMDETGDISPVEKLYVLEEKGDWIRFRVTPKDSGWSAWTQKKFTISIEKLNAEREAKFGKCPAQIGTNGSVRIVKNYLKSIAKDPDSLIYDQWSEVYYNENDGWIVYCVYRGKNSFGAYDKTANWFVIQHGQVVEIKEADAYSFN